MNDSSSMKDRSSSIAATIKKPDKEPTSLIHAPDREFLTVVQVSGSEGLCSKLAVFGISEGQVVRKRQIDSMCLIRTKNKVIGLSLDDSAKIRVR